MNEVLGNTGPAPLQVPGKPMISQPEVLEKKKKTWRKTAKKRVEEQDDRDTQIG